jgi:hypothetical protein
MCEYCIKLDHFDHINLMYESVKKVRAMGHILLFSFTYCATLLDHNRLYNIMLALFYLASSGCSQAVCNKSSAHEMRSLLNFP